VQGCCCFGRQCIANDRQKLTKTGCLLCLPKSECSCPTNDGYQLVYPCCEASCFLERCAQNPWPSWGPCQQRSSQHRQQHQQSMLQIMNKELSKLNARVFLFRSLIVEMSIYTNLLHCQSLITGAFSVSYFPFLVLFSITVLI
jgi:hypothetical protein